jgi:hypothetical protein
MNTLQTLTCALAIELSACTNVDVKKVEAPKQEEIVSSQSTHIVQNSPIVQDIDKILFEGDFEIKNYRWIPNGTHHLKFYQKDEVNFLEIDYQDGSMDKYHSVDSQGNWRYVEEIRGKAITLIPSTLNLNSLHELIENHSIDTEKDINHRRELGRLLYDQTKEFKIKKEEHEIKIKYFLEQITQFTTRQP